MYCDVIFKGFVRQSLSLSSFTKKALSLNSHRDTTFSMYSSLCDSNQKWSVTCYGERCKYAAPINIIILFCYCLARKIDVGGEFVPPVKGLNKDAQRQLHGHSMYRCNN